MKYSKQRECILGYLRSVNTHPTAATVHQEVRREIPNISLGTVYRNLKRLEEEGEIVTLQSALDRQNYDGCTSPHQHFICVKCEQIFDLSLTTHLDEIEKRGYKVTRESTVLYGKCPDCSDE